MLSARHKALGLSKSMVSPRSLSEEKRLLAKEK